MGGYFKACTGMSALCSTYDSGMNTYCTQTRRPRRERGSIHQLMIAGTHDHPEPTDTHTNTDTHSLALSLLSRSHTQSPSVGILSGPDS